MKSSALQLRKMSLIEYLLGIQHEKVFDKLEANIHKSLKEIRKEDVVFSKQDIIDRANFSHHQIKKGLTISQKDLEEQSKKW